MKKVAVILSGCGARDGSEIREAVFAMLALSKNNIKYDCFSVDKEQHIVYDHCNEKEMNESRNMLVESARLARGKVRDISLLNPDEFGGILFPGGYGASINLADFGIIKSENFKIEDEIWKAMKAFNHAKKPMCFLCIASVLAVKLIPNATITLGKEEGASDLARKMGANVISSKTNTPVIDKINKIVSVPCYLVDVTLSELYDGIELAVKEFITLSKQ